ncbi:type II toxin-antitoxin system HicA family toxin [Bacteroidetes/Chlorobi group bacterium ChocPot_Mid]|nr:MAG: type II toxin-antitoxin system HicA family toxin [Bacteroidetes/Chlorobi group bacterium ChocPot_Mid]
MSILAGITYNDLIKKLKAAGFVFDRQAKGSHEIWYHPVKKLRTTIPNHPGTFKIGTLKSILKQTNIKTEEFIEL